MLQKITPAVNQGVFLGEIAHDLAGVARTKLGAHDLDAYEYSSTGGDMQRRFLRTICVSNNRDTVCTPLIGQGTGALRQQTKAYDASLISTPWLAAPGRGKNTIFWLPRALMRAGSSPAGAS